MNDDYDNSKTDREMLDRLTGGTELPGDDTVSFSFPSVLMPGVDHLGSMAQAAAEVLRRRGHLGPFRVTITVACQDGDPGCEPQLWDDGTRTTTTGPEPAVVSTVGPEGTIGHDEIRRAWCMGTAPHDEHDFNGGMWCPGLTEIDGGST